MDQAFSAPFGVHNEIRGGHTRYGETFSLARCTVTFKVVRHGAVEVKLWDPIHLQQNFTGNECAWIKLSIQLTLPLDRRGLKTFLMSGCELDVVHEPAPWHELIANFLGENRAFSWKPSIYAWFCSIRATVTPIQ